MVTKGLAGRRRSFGETEAVESPATALSPKLRAPVPRLLVVTDRRQVAGSLGEVIAAAVDGGARHVLLRERDLPRPRRLALAVELRTLLAGVGGQLIVAGPDPLCDGPERDGSGRDHGVDGTAVHLSSYDPGPGTPGGPPGTATLVGRSCHDGDSVPSTVDYVTMSPVFVSPSKPGYGPALGVDGLRRLVGRTGKPVLALGGIESAARLVACRAAGAYGVAVMGAVMRSAAPQRVITSLLAADVDNECDVRRHHGSTVMP